MRLAFLLGVAVAEFARLKQSSILLHSTRTRREADSSSDYSDDTERVITFAQGGELSEYTAQVTLQAGFEKFSVFEFEKSIVV